MRINTNISAMNTYSRLTAANNSKSGSLAKLSSGLRINRAGDDAAGLAISEKMRGQIGGLKQATRNAQDGISLIQTAEGALNETHSILNRMRDLAVQSSNGTNTDEDRIEIDKEIKELQKEITRISTDTEFNTKKLLTGTSGSKIDTSATNTVLKQAGVADMKSNGAKAGTYKISADAAGKLTMKDPLSGDTEIIDNGGGKQTLNFSKFGISIETNEAYVADAAVGDITVVAGAQEPLKFQIGANATQTTTLTIDNMSANALGVDADQIDLSNAEDAEAAITLIDDATALVSAERSKLGAMQNRLEHTINNLTTTAENLSEAESRIRDVDMAEEMMAFTKSNILSQAATSMLAQANQMPQGVLQLLQ